MQGGDHVPGIDTNELPRDLVQIDLFLDPEIAAQEGAVDRGKRRYRDLQLPTEEFIDRFSLELVGENEARVAGVRPADDRQGRRTASLDNARIEAWDFGRATHVEVEIAAPELFNASRCLP